MREARELCEAVGQPWRAASLGGGGAEGPLPLGAAADEADAADPVGEQAGDLGAEVGCGGVVAGPAGGGVSGQPGPPVFGSRPASLCMFPAPAWHGPALLCCSHWAIHTGRSH